jgi:hypothetical protein
MKSREKRSRPNRQNLVCQLFDTIGDADRVQRWKLKRTANQQRERSLKKLREPSHHRMILSFDIGSQ